MSVVDLPGTIIAELKKAPDVLSVDLVESRLDSSETYTFHPFSIRDNLIAVLVKGPTGTWLFHVETKPKRCRQCIQRANRVWAGYLSAVETASGTVL